MFKLNNDKRISNCGDYNVYLRFFTHNKEVPIGGHATIATHYAQEIENNLDTIRVFNKTGTGIFLVDILKKNSDFKIVMTQVKS
jgi:PhzF family phenazine biosynthesis protein